MGALNPLLRIAFEPCMNMVKFWGFSRLRWLAGTDRGAGNSKSLFELTPYVSTTVPKCQIHLVDYYSNRGREPDPSQTKGRAPVNATTTATATPSENSTTKGEPPARILPFRGNFYGSSRAFGNDASTLSSIVSWPGYAPTLNKYLPKPEWTTKMRTCSRV